MILETDRLYLRQMAQSDFAALCRILQDEQAMYAYERPFTDEEVQSWLDRQLARYEQYGFGLWAVILKETGGMIGQCGLTMQPWKGQEVLEVGYLFERAHWRHGYATEAAIACKRYAFETLGASEVCSIIRDTNTASQNVARRNGMVPADTWIKRYRGVDMPHIRYIARKDGPKAPGADGRIDYFKQDEYWRRHVHRKLEEDLWIDEYRDVLPPSGKALDLGCGIGQYSRRLMAYGYSVVSADISAIALAEVAKFNPQTVKIDMREPLPFDDGAFDLVFASLSIHYFSDAGTKALIAEIRRILKAGGMFVGSVNGMQGAEHIKDTAQELEYHYYWNIDRYFRFFDEADLRRYLAPFASCQVDERETVRFENKKNYLVFICKN